LLKRVPVAASGNYKSGDLPVANKYLIAPLGHIRSDPPQKIVSCEAGRNKRYHVDFIARDVGVID
jgi:hypothetical protein